MSNVVDNSTGATFVLGSSAYAVRITGISITGEQAAALKTSHLATTVTHTYIPGDLLEPVQLDCEIFYDPNEPPPTGTVQTGTLTFPVPSGSTNGATLAGSCFLVSSGGSLRVEELMTGNFKIQYAGTVTRVDAS